jgi:hypothetical protein
MNRKKRSSALIGLVILLSAAAIAAERIDHSTDRRLNSATLESYERSTVLTLAYGDQRDQIGRTIDIPEELPLGPEGFALAGDGIVILDTLNEEIKQFDTNGRVENAVKVGRGSDIVAIAPNELLVAVPTSQSVVRVRDAATTSVAVAEPVEVFRPEHAKQFARRGSSARVHSVSPPSYMSRLKNEREGVIENATTGSTFAVRTSERLGSLNVLGADGRGNIFVVVEELLNRNDGDVRRTVRKFSPAGELLAMIEIPIDNHTFPQRDLLVNEDGTIFHMQPLRETLVVQKWTRHE